MALEYAWYLTMSTATVHSACWGLAVVAAAGALVGCHARAVPPHEPAQARAAVEPARARPTVELTLEPAGEGIWLHTSVRELESYGRVVSHGLVVRGEGGAVLIDTAWGNDATEELLAEVRAATGLPPVSAVLTDFHADRAGGVEALLAADVEVHTSRGILDRIDAVVPTPPLPAPASALSLAGVDLEVFAPGPGHSPENLVVWLPESRVLFGGCLVRPFESRGLGNTADADLSRWGPTIRAVRSRYPRAAVVYPSHGAPGGPELLDHTLAIIDGGRWAQALESDEPPPPVRMAVTVDDLPRHGPVPAGTTRTEIHQRLLEAFGRHQVPRVWGFVNGAGVSGDDERQALEQWIDAGHPLGNHTWSHPDLREITVADYLADIDRNEPMLAELMGARGKMFRYPYLQQGLDEASTAAIRAHLSAAGYTIAEVSVDFWDWDYQSPFVRCRAEGFDDGVKALRRAFMQRAVTTLAWHKAASVRAFGRPIAHVLLLHAGAFTAEMIEPLLTAYEKRGVRWITLEEALADPVYRDVPVPPKTRGDVIVEQAVASLGVDHPPWSPHPGALLGALCRPSR